MSAACATRRATVVRVDGRTLTLWCYPDRWVITEGAWRDYTLAPVLAVADNYAVAEVLWHYIDCGDCS